MFALVASGAGKYPFEGRLLLFIVPSLLIITADGAEEMRFRLWERSRWLGISLLCLLLYHPLLLAKDHLIEPRVREEMRSVLEYVRRNWKDGDTLYLSFDSQWAFRYYAPKVGLGDVDPVVGDCCGDGRQDCAGELEFLQGRNRVWVVFSHLTEPDAIRIKDLTMNRLDRIGARSKAVSAPGAEAYLFDFGRG